MVKVREQQPSIKGGRVEIGDWLHSLSARHDQSIVDQLNQAVSLISETEYLQAGIITADILEDLGMDSSSILAGLLYQAFHNKKVPADKIDADVRALLAGVQDMDSVHERNPLNLSQDPDKNKENLYNFRKMLLAVVADVRVVLIQLAKYLCTMRMAAKSDENTQSRLALEAAEIYAPLANRLGVGQIKWELEDFAFRYSNPELYKNIAKFLDEKRLDRDKYIKEITAKISEVLASHKIDAQVNGRAKHIYSIWRKMQRKAVGYGEIYDVRAVRIIVPSISDCYGALGLVHGMWQHVPKEFDDYIASPKDNGYQSLHTAVLGPGGKVLEVQIRTEQMHEQSELGVAAHWRYKEGTQHEPYYEKQLNQLRKVLNWHEDPAEAHDPDVSLDEMRAEFFADRVYVFTPNGDVMDLPVGATPIDYAYHIHSSVGDRCRGAKVNGKMVPLNSQLTSGDQVEILTAKEGGPSRDWLNPHLSYIATSKARSKISQWFKQLDRDQNISDGRELLLRELKRLGFANVSIKDIVKHVANCNTENDLLAGLGNGDVKMSQVVGALQRLRHPVQSLPQVKRQHTSTEAKVKDSEIIIAGIDNLVSHMALCCNPIPGDAVIGYVTLGQGIAIHRQDCLNILHVDEEKKSRLIEVSWGSKTDNKYAIEISVKAYDRRGLLRDVSALISAENVDLLDAKTHTDKTTNICDMRLQIEVSGLEALGRLLSKIQQVTNVIEVFRVDK